MEPTRPREFVRLELSPEQQRQVQRTTGRESVALELTLQELEARIQPRIALNHNETLLVDG